MPRNRDGGEIGFGSDSFLDIIANIVGILIILIVVAGVRVSRAPLAPTPVEQEPAAAAARFAATEPLPIALHVAAALPPPEARPIGGTALDPRGIPIRARVVAAVAPRPNPELERRIRDLQVELAGLTAAATEAIVTSDGLEARLVLARSRVAAAERALAEEERRLAATAGDVDRLERDLARSAATIVDLRRRVAEEEARGPRVEPLRHRMTGISRLVKGREVHFRLAGGRVAPIPLDDLLEELKDDVQRRGDWIVKFREHRGRVGPIDGFQLEYVVERQEPSALDQVRGAGLVRIGISRWELVPTEAAGGETFEEAMQPESRFRRALGVVDDDPTLTLWVYPDSFALYRRLQQVAHDNDLLVAARPLPEGVPIAGSPGGSRSTGQ